jgi:microcompartment protein CcmL/EutN
MQNRREAIGGLEFIRGEVSSVRASLDAGKLIGEGTVIDEFLIPNVHPSLFPAITGTTEIDNLEALGIIETFSVASTIEAGDKAAKTAPVTLLEMRLGIGLGGKSYVTLTGDVSSVKSSVEAGAKIAEEKGLLVNKVVIPHPTKELMRLLISGDEILE